MLSDEKMPIHFKPAKILSSSSLSLKVAFDETAETRSFSFDDAALRIFCVASAHVIFSFRKLCSSSERKPMSTKTLIGVSTYWKPHKKIRDRTLTNSGKPAYRRVPLMIVFASGMAYLSWYGVESPSDCSVSHTHIMSRWIYEGSSQNIRDNG